MKNWEYLIEIKHYFKDLELNYKLTDIFEDYGLKKLVKLITQLI